MQLRGKEIIVHSGETFTLDMSVKNRDGTPFIIDKELTNCYLLFSISSSKYTQNNRYLRNWWLDLTHISKFDSTIPVEIDEFTETNLAIDGKDYVYASVEDGVTKYKYWDSESSEFVDYEFRIVKCFDNDTTKEWRENTYTYSITLVAGQSTYKYLQSIWKSEFGTIPPTLEEAWKIAITNEPELVNIIEQPVPVCNYSDVLVFVEPSKLTVLSEIKGSL